MQELVPATPPAPPVATANLLTGLGVDEYFQRSDPVNGTLTFITDALGSPLALTNSSGAITTSYSYEPFGKVIVLLLTHRPNCAMIRAWKQSVPSINGFPTITLAKHI